MSEPWLARHARERPATPALDGLTYAELHRRAAATDPGPLLSMAPGEELAVALHARWLRGLGAVPLDPRLTRAELGERRAVAPRPGDALVVFTSGTTAAPRPVRLSFENLHANAVGSALALGLRRDERWLCPLPLSHVGGLMILARSLVYGTTALIEPWDVDRVGARLAAGEATLASLVPTQLRRLLDAGLREPPELRAVLLGGGPVEPELLRRAAELGVPVAQTYGLTEAASQVTVSEPGDAATAGWPLPGTTVRLAGDGEILVEGPTVAGGGLLATGDLGRFDDRGRLTVIGRKADTIVTGGENVAPAEVEAVLLAHPAVADAAVFGRPHPEWGETVQAKVVLRDAPGKALPGDLPEWCAGRLARYKVPKAIEIVDVIPRTSSGKIIRRYLS